MLLLKLIGLNQERLPPLKTKVCADPVGPSVPCANSTLPLTSRADNSVITLNNNSFLAQLPTETEDVEEDGHCLV